MKRHVLFAAVLFAGSSTTNAAFLNEHMTLRRSGHSLQQEDTSIKSYEPMAVVTDPPEWEMHATERPAGVGNAPDHVIKWKDESDIPKVLQFMLALTWVSMLASVPFISPLLGDKQTTKTQYLVCGTTVVALFGGFYLFTHVILFQSTHFDTHRPLTVVECCYFMAQTITTIGYGDIGPAKTRGQIFVGIYVIFSLFVIAFGIEEFTNHLIKVASQEKNPPRKSVRKSSTLGHAQSSVFALEREDMTVEYLLSPKKPSMKPFCTALLVFAIIDVCFVIFYCNYPGENKTFFQALYMSLITLGSIGFGFFTPVTEGGMIFAAFSMVLGCTAFVVVIGEFTALVYQSNEYERYHRFQGKVHAMQHLKEIAQGESSVNAVQFLQFVLSHTGKVSEGEIDNIMSVFSSLNPKDGAVSVDEIQKATTPRDITVHTPRALT
jgi:hypothetical protein